MPKKTEKQPLEALLAGGKARLYTVGGVTGTLWVIEIVDELITRPGSASVLDGYGIHPHELKGLVGIIFAPFLHAGFEHLLANTVGFVALGLLVTTRRLSDFWSVFWGTAVTAGLGCWVFGGLGSTNEVHIGASGVIFGFLGFLMARGWFERKVGAILLSLIVTWFFHGMLFGLVPQAESNISWQAHVFGWLGGVGMAWFMARLQKRAGSK